MTDSTSSESTDSTSTTTPTSSVTTAPSVAQESTTPVAGETVTADPTASSTPAADPTTSPVAPTPAPEPATAPAPAPMANLTTDSPVGPAATTPTPAPIAPSTPEVVAPSPAPSSFIGTLDSIIHQAKLDELGIAGMEKEVQDYILHVLEKGNQLTKDWVLHQLSYLKAMSPTTPTTVAEGARHQENYFREMMTALDNNTGADFREMMNAVLAIIHQTKTSGAHAFHLWARFLPDWALGQPERQKFLNLGTLFRTTSDGSTRQMALKQIDLAKALDGLLPATREKLENYYRAT